MRFMNTKNLLGIGAAALLIGTVIALFLLAGPSRGQDKPAPAPDAEEDVITVKSVKPKQDSEFTTSIEQPAFVEGYYTADLMARVAGEIKPNGVTVDIHDRVKAGDPLVLIDVPDLEQDVALKKAIVKQREAERDRVEKASVMEEKAVKAAGKMVKFKGAEVGRAEASERFRKKELDRFKELAKGPNSAVTPDIVDERTEFWESAVAGSAAARFAVEQANAELEKANAKLEAAKADEKVAESLIGVARAERDKAQALLNYATIRAPFDGIVTQRKVDPGDFVQNAATGRTDPLLTVVRDDIVTVYMKVPDKFAHFVSTNTEAIIQLDTGKMRDVLIHAKVTRYADSLETPQHDRTMRVEVDVFNGSVQEYEAEKKEPKTDLKSPKLPDFPRVEGNLEGKDVQTQGLHLLPGQYGKMKLVLKHFRQSVSVAAQRGGQPGRHLLCVHGQEWSGRESACGSAGRQWRRSEGGPHREAARTNNPRRIEGG